MNPFKDKVAVVTGGTSGIGRALCEELGARGAAVIVAGRNAERAREVVSSICQRGGQAHAVHVDVSVESSVAELVDHAVREYGRLDYLFNNAGISVMGEARDLGIEHWRSVIDVNLWGVVYGTTMAYQAMLRQGGGHIVNIASGAGLVPFGAIPYVATKHAVVSLSLILRAEAADLGVKVSVVCPGGVQSSLSQNSAVVKMPRDKVRAYLAKYKLMAAGQAARVILHGVARNHAIIVFPISARILWWLYRLSPSLNNWLLLKFVRNFRKMLRAP